MSFLMPLMPKVAAAGAAALTWQTMKNYVKANDDKKLAQPAVVEMTRPIAYFTDLETNYRLSLSVLPEEIDLTAESLMQELDIIKRGEVVLPGGKKAEAIAWKGTLYGESRKPLSLVKADLWHPPKNMIEQFIQWSKKSTPMRIIVTHTTINHDVYIRKFNHKVKGAHGDYEYDIELIESMPIEVYNIDEKKSMQGSGTDDSGLNDRTEKTKNKVTHEVKPGEDMFDVALQNTGDGSKYSDIARLNMITSPLTLMVGTSLLLR